MRTLYSLFLVIGFAITALARQPATTSPLSKYAKEWNDKKYLICNTASQSSYMTDQEKEIIYIVNLARMNPKLFCKSVVKKAGNSSSFIDTISKEYYKTLVAEMQKMSPLKILQPDSLCALSARAHATGLGTTGKTGHARVTPESSQLTYFGGECCYYGTNDPLSIVLTLLIDQGVKSLGHRRICFYAKYTKIGAGLAPHIQYGYAAVLDFHYKN